MAHPQIKVHLPKDTDVVTYGSGCSVCSSCRSVVTVSADKGRSSGFIQLHKCLVVLTNGQSCNGNLVAVKDEETKPLLDLLFGRISFEYDLDDEGSFDDGEDMR